MSEEKKKTARASAEDVERFLQRTGFIFEMRMKDLLEKRGYDCEINASFLDLEGNIDREIDIIASKVINGINVHFVIECKQSPIDKWIFICTKSDSHRFYYAVKHLPSVAVQVLQEKELFDNLHPFNRQIPLAHNYICYSIDNNKKVAHLQIDECVHKTYEMRRIAALFSVIASC
jgi:hypothetical protein